MGGPGGLTDAFASGLILPAAVLALLGWAVPRLLALVIPEGVRPLMLIALLSTLVMGASGALFFAGLYLWQGMPMAALFEAGLAAGVVHFGRLSLISALLWGPIMVLSIAGLPKNWIKETW